jgi:hypothetical protein
VLEVWRQVHHGNACTDLMIYFVATDNVTTDNTTTDTDSDSDPEH